MSYIGANWNSSTKKWEKAQGAKAEADRLGLSGWDDTDSAEEITKENAAYLSQVYGDFGAIDKNKDGSVDMTELQAYAATQQSNSDKSKLKGVFLLMNSPSLLEAMDIDNDWTNKQDSVDGKISQKTFGQTLGILNKGQNVDGTFSSGFNGVSGATGPSGGGVSGGSGSGVGGSGSGAGASGSGGGVTPSGMSGDIAGAKKNLQILVDKGALKGSGGTLINDDVLLGIVNGSGSAEEKAAAKELLGQGSSGSSGTRTALLGLYAAKGASGDADLNEVYSFTGSSGPGSGVNPSGMSGDIAGAKKDLKFLVEKGALKGSGATLLNNEMLMQIAGGSGSAEEKAAAKRLLGLENGSSGVKTALQSLYASSGGSGDASFDEVYSFTGASGVSSAGASGASEYPKDNISKFDKETGTYKPAAFANKARDDQFIKSQKVTDDKGNLNADGYGALIENEDVKKAIGIDGDKAINADQLHDAVASGKLDDPKFAKAKAAALALLNGNGDGLTALDGSGSDGLFNAKDVERLKKDPKLGGPIDPGDTKNVQGDGDKKGAAGALDTILKDPKYKDLKMINDDVLKKISRTETGPLKEAADKLLGLTENKDIRKGLETLYAAKGGKTDVDRAETDAFIKDPNSIGTPAPKDTKIGDALALMGKHFDVLQKAAGGNRDLTDLTKALDNLAGKSPDDKWWDNNGFGKIEKKDRQALIDAAKLVKDNPEAKKAMDVNGDNIVNQREVNAAERAWKANPKYIGGDKAANQDALDSFSRMGWLLGDQEGGGDRDSFDMKDALTKLSKLDPDKDDNWKNGALKDIPYNERKDWIKRAKLILDNPKLMELLGATDGAKGNDKNFSDAAMLYKMMSN